MIEAILRAALAIAAYELTMYLLNKYFGDKKAKN